MKGTPRFEWRAAPAGGGDEMTDEMLTEFLARAADLPRETREEGVVNGCPTKLAADGKWRFGGGSFLADSDGAEELAYDLLAAGMTWKEASNLGGEGEPVGPAGWLAGRLFWRSTDVPRLADRYMRRMAKAGTPVASYKVARKPVAPVLADEAGAA